MSTHYVNLEGFERDLRKLPKTAERAMIRGLRSAALRTKAEVVIQIDTAKPYPAVDRGTMRRSVGVDNHPDGALLSVDAPYAAAMERGTRPFFPPLEPIVAWLKRKGIVKRKVNAVWEGDTLVSAKKQSKKSHEAEIRSVAYAIAVKFSREGIEPRHFFAKAMEKVPKFLRAEIDRELEKL